MDCSISWCSLKRVYLVVTDAVDQPSEYFSNEASYRVVSKHCHHSKKRESGLITVRIMVMSDKLTILTDGTLVTKNSRTTTNLR